MSGRIFTSKALVIAPARPVNSALGFPMIIILPKRQLVSDMRLPPSLDCMPLLIDAHDRLQPLDPVICVVISADWDAGSQCDPVPKWFKHAVSSVFVNAPKHPVRPIIWITVSYTIGVSDPEIGALVCSRIHHELTVLQSTRKVLKGS